MDSDRLPGQQQGGGWMPMRDQSGHYPPQGSVGFNSPFTGLPTQNSENCHRCLRRDHRKAVKRMRRHAMIINPQRAAKAARIERDAAARNQLYEKRRIEREAKEYGAMRASLNERYGFTEIVWKFQTPGYQQPQGGPAYEGNTALLNGSDQPEKYTQQLMAHDSGISQMSYGMEYFPGEVEDIHHHVHKNPEYPNVSRLRQPATRKRRTMPTHKRPRGDSRESDTSPLEPDPVTGYGTVAAADEVGPIFDYTDLEVSMRGGGPYGSLEDSDTEGDEGVDGKASKHMKIVSSLGKGTLQRMERFMDDDNDEEDGASSSSLKFTRHGDTKTSDPNNHLWGVGPLSTSGMNPTSHRGRGHGRRNQRRSAIAPGLVPFKTKVDPYAEVPHGFQFSLNQAENAPLKQTWTTLDPKTGAVKYEKGGQEAQEESPEEPNAWDPSDVRNTPLAATFGTSRVVLSTGVKDTKVPEAGGLTAKALQRLDRQVRRELAEPIDGYIDITTSSLGSPNAPPSEPSVVYNSLPRVVGGASELGGIPIDGEPINEQPGAIDADVRENFITNINAMHDVRPTPGTFERRNQGWMAKTKNPVAYVNEFGEGNVFEVKMKVETRTRMMNEKGEYAGKNLGEVKKRHKRGFSEMINARKDEMIRATKEYREWKAMSLEDRMERLTLLRQPIDLWKGRPGTDQADQEEIHHLPRIYKQRVLRRKEKQRMRAILADKAKQKKQDESASSSFGTAGTGDTLDTIGELGDCDDLPVASASSGSRTPRPGDETLQAKMRRALDVDKSRGSKSRRRSASGSSSVARSTNSTMSMNVEPGFQLPGRLFHGRRGGRSAGLFSGGSGTGNSVAGPRPSGPPSSYRPSPSPSPSPNPWCSLDTGSETASTVRGLRNAPLEGHLFNGPGTERSSDGTHATDELAAFEDDSPILNTTADTGISSATLPTEEHVEQYCAAKAMSETRGRVVTVSLHAVQGPGGPDDVLPKFTPGTIASKVFGGLVQEFQLHPEKRTAVVVFVYPTEARSFVHHFRNIREKGTQHDIRALQIEVSWYRGAESQSILPAQSNLLKHSITDARRCILLSRIPKDKNHRTVSKELSDAFGTLLVRISLITPPQNYILQSEGRQALVEFANLQDAVQAYDDLNSGLIAGYENANPQYRTEPTEKRQSAKDYCGCLGCEEKRDDKAQEMEAKKQKRDEQMRDDDDGMSSYSDTASE
ncbi:hypothetical protein O988_01263 [Pseudogymnoascus sp. VKM F-3808]|nr:hypothetical protein O988_01263 [Pseudogymnoascus sp. VKM F-3808]